MQNFQNNPLQQVMCVRIESKLNVLKPMLQKNSVKMLNVYDQ